MFLNWQFFPRKRLRRHKSLSEPIERNRGLREDIYLSPKPTIEAERKVSFFKIDSNLDLKKVATSKNDKNKLEREKKIDLSVANFFNIGYYIVIPLILCLILGVLLDKIYNTKPIFSLLFIFLGSIASFYNLAKIIKENRL